MPDCPTNSKWKGGRSRAKAFQAQGGSDSWRGLGGDDGVVVVEIRASFLLERSVFQDRPLGVE